MRVSVRKDDPGYDLDCIGCKVWLDGVEIHEVVTADTEKCFARVLVKDDDGEYVIIDTPEGRQVKEAIITGPIEITNLPDKLQPKSQNQPADPA
jgi:hypothetical protein